MLKTIVLLAAVLWLVGCSTAPNSNCSAMLTPCGSAPAISFVPVPTFGVVITR